MRVLALDTTTRAGSVAVVDDGRVVVEQVGDAARTHAERLPGDIVHALELAHLRMSDIDLFAVAVGPGSFTGLRIGIATIQGLAFVERKQVAPISALRALAEAAAEHRPQGTRVAAWMDAYRKDIFSALYDVDAPGGIGVNTLRELEAASVGRPAETLDRWRALGTPAAVCGDGAVLYASAIPEGVAVVPPPPLAGLIGRLALVAAHADGLVDPANLQPLYVRRPDAEVARDLAASKR